MREGGNTYFCFIPTYNDLEYKEIGCNLWHVRKANFKRQPWEPTQKAIRYGAKKL